MPRYKLTIEYDGAPFVGWRSSRTNGPSVQRARWKTAVKAICGEHVLRCTVPGRTDASVHALRARLAHCDIAKHFVPGRFRDGLNAHLRPHPIGVLSAEIVPDTFEARFSAEEAALPLSHQQSPAPVSRSTSAAPGIPAAAARYRCHARNGAAPCRQNTTLRRSATPSARPNRREDIDQLDVARDGDADQHHHLRARSCMARCARWWAH